MLADDRRRVARRADRRSDSRVHPARRRRSTCRRRRASTSTCSRLTQIARRNTTFRSYIGLGYHDTITPSVILRMVMENPGWYTPYTPYQAEIAQGRLESLLNFQTMVADLTGMEVANASLLDEATAAAEAMTLLHRVATNRPAAGERGLLPGQRSLLSADDRRRCGRAPSRSASTCTSGRSTAWRSTPARLRRAAAVSGRARLVQDLAPFIARAHEAGVLVAVGTDLLALALLTPPGEMGADVVFGNSQRFGVPLGYGGPHAAFFATRNAFVRQMPGPHHRRVGRRARPARPTGWRSPRASSTSAARRRRRTSARRRRCSPTWRRCTPSITARTGSQAIAGRVHVLARVLEARARALGLRRSATRTTSTRCASRCRPASRQCAAARARSGHQPPLSRRAHRRHRAQRDGDHRRRPRHRRRVRMRRWINRHRRAERFELPNGVLALHARRRSAGVTAPDERVPDASGLQHAPLRNADDALHPQPRAEGPRPRHVDDSARARAR